MPTYEYRCKNCGDFEVEQKIIEPSLTKCPHCGGEVERLISCGNFILKGTGWYKDGYNKKPQKKLNKDVKTNK